MVVKKNRFPYPEDWEAEAEGFLSDTEITFDDDQEKPKFPETLFVYNVPTVDAGDKETFKRLQDQLKKKIGGSKENPGFELDLRCREGAAKSDGCAWLKFPTRAEMEKACKRVDGMKFGATPLGAIPFDDYELIFEMSEKFTAPASSASQLAYLDDCQNWLLDEKSREQILLRFQQETEIHWLDPLEALVAYYCGEREKEKGKLWCDWKVMWSVHGNFLVTCHRPGICLWGGTNMTQKRKFLHAEVRDIMFSPTEEFVITWNGRKDDDKSYKIWEVASGKILKENATPQCNPSGIKITDRDGAERAAFPHMLFSPDSKYFARCTSHEIAVHEMPSCKLYNGGGGPFRFDNGVAHFQFSPRDNYIAVWSPQMNDSPSNLTVQNIVTGEKLQTRSRTNFNAQLEWQSEGDFLCVILTKRGKQSEKSKSAVAGKTKNLDILRMREKHIPVETIDLEADIKGFFWEPKGNRFALLTECKDSPSKTMLCFYSLANSKCEQVCSFELQSSQFNKVFWAPEGQYFVVAVLGDGQMIWGRLHPDTNVFELLYKDEQANLTNIEWDSRGRYVLSSVTQPIESSQQNLSVAQDAGFTLWTFQGRPLHQENIEKLYLASFRPNPPTLLNTEEEQNIRKHLKTHSRRFEQLDDEARNKQRKEERERKEMKIREFKAICQTLNTNFVKHAQSMGWEDAHQRWKEAHRWSDRNEVTEELISTTEELIQL